MMFGSSCDDKCLTCSAHYSESNCLAGHGDNHYSPASIFTIVRSLRTKRTFTVKYIDKNTSIRRYGKPLDDDDVKELKLFLVRWSIFIALMVIIPIIALSFLIPIWMDSV